MPELTFVIGAVATGKTCFAEQMLQREHMEYLDIYDYQQRVHHEEEYGKFVPLGEPFWYLAQANDLLLEDVLKKLEAGRDVILEQTHYKAKRRIMYIDAIKARFPDVSIAVYVMCPSDERWKENIKKRELENQSQCIMEERDELEFPNVSEGFDAIYQVTDDGVELRMDPPKPELPTQARAELAEEAKQMRQEEEDRRRRIEETVKPRIKTVKEQKEGST